LKVAFPATSASATSAVALMYEMLRSETALITYGPLIAAKAVSLIDTIISSPMSKPCGIPVVNVAVKKVVNILSEPHPKYQLYHNPLLIVSPY
jgi:hypothetical protein